MKTNKINRSRIEDYTDPSYYAVQETGSQSLHLRDQMRNIMELIQPFDDELILDIGSGSGKYPAIMSHTGYPVVTDFSPVSVQFAYELAGKQGKRERMAFVQTRGENLPFMQDTYDKVTALDIVEHINQEEYRKLVREVLRVLKPGGVFCVYTPNKTYFIEYIYQIIFGRSISPLHFGLKTDRELVQPLKAAGFRVQDVYFRPNYLPVLKQLEQVAMHIPVVGQFARRRICIRAYKPA